MTTKGAIEVAFNEVFPRYWLCETDGENFNFDSFLWKLRQDKNYLDAAAKVKSRIVSNGETVYHLEKLYRSHHVIIESFVRYNILT